MIFSILIGFTITALTEYLLHRLYLHKDHKHPHITEHHVLFNGNRTYENPNVEPKDIFSNIWYILLTIMPSLIITFLIFQLLGKIYLTIIIASIIYAIWIESVHYLFHSPSGIILENTQFFINLKEHHRQHHIIYNKNFGIGSSFIDYIFRTKK